MNDLSNWIISPPDTWDIADSYAGIIDTFCVNQSCTMTLIDDIDMSQHQDMSLSLRHIEVTYYNNIDFPPPDPGSLSVSLTSDGITWDHFHTFSSDISWAEWEKLIPDKYMTENFNIRFIFDDANSGSAYGTVVFLADVTITDDTTSSNSGGSNSGGGNSGGGNSAGTDTTAPTITINSPTNNEIITSDSVTVSISATDLSGIKNITIIPPTGNQVVSTKPTFSYTFIGLSSGSQTFTINVWDNSDNLATDSITVIIDPPPGADTTPPTVSIYRPNDGDIFTTDSVEFRAHIFEGDSSGIRNIQVTINNVAVTDTIDERINGDNANPRTTLTGLSRGSNTIMIYVENGDGYANSDSVTITIDTPAPEKIDSFFNSFETDISDWILGGDDGEYWHVKSPVVMVPNSTSTNNVVGSDDCDSICSMKMVDYVDLTEMSSPKLSFYRFVSTWQGTIPSEGIIAYVSENNGNTWSVLESFTDGDSKADELWHKQEYDLSPYSTSTQFKLRFDAISSSPSERMELDDIRIYDADDIYGISSLDITSSGSNPTHAKTGDTLMISMQVNEPILDANTTVLNRTTVSIINDAMLTTSLIVYENDTNGNSTFSITTSGASASLTVSELNLTGINVFIDTAKPVITLNGNANITIERYDTYTDAGATITDEDPKYNGTVSSNASSINTDTVGSYFIEYHAPADLAGNIPDNVTRMITIQDTKHPTITALNITTNNPSGTHVAANQKLTITLETNEILTGTNATILNQAITM